MNIFKILPRKGMRLTLLCFLSLFSHLTLATNGNFYLSATAGASSANLRNTNPEINYYHGLLNDAYPTHSENSTAAVLGLQGGYEFVLPCSKPVFDLGLGIYTAPKNYSYRGGLVETPLDGPASLLYDYKFRMMSTRLMAEAQMTWRANHVMPFVNVGVGSAWVRMDSYSEMSIDNIGYPPLPPFQSRTQTNFAYQAGLGLGYEFNFPACKSQFRHERILLGYRYVNLGNASFGIRGAVYPFKLNFDNLTNNDIYLTYTHLF